jgi:hypothetical protein
MATYNDGSAGLAVARLAEIGGSVLRDCRYEIQEAGDFLRLSAEITADLDEAGQEALRDRITRGLSRDLPKRKGAFPWMVVLTRKGEMVESIFPEMLL